MYKLLFKLKNVGVHSCEPMYVCMCPGLEWNEGAKLYFQALHVDKVETHVISVILNLNQSVSSPWRLNILDSLQRTNQ